jgi:hypothetical protein
MPATLVGRNQCTLVGRLFAVGLDLSTRSPQFAQSLGVPGFPSVQLSARAIEDEQGTSLQRFVAGATRSCRSDDDHHGADLEPCPCFAIHPLPPLDCERM